MEVSKSTGPTMYAAQEEAKSYAPSVGPTWGTSFQREPTTTKRIITVSMGYACSLQEPHQLMFVNRTVDQIHHPRPRHGKHSASWPARVLSCPPIDIVYYY